MTNICYQCNGGVQSYFTTNDFNRGISDNDFTYFICPKCKFVFLSPIPEDLGDYYAGDYSAYNIPKSIEDLQNFSKKLRWRLDLVQNHTNGKSLLEIGSSYGAFAFEAAQAGYSVTAIEMESACVDFIVNNIPEIEIIQSDDAVSSMMSLEKKYDVIALWHVIEHVPNPWKVLEECANRLNSGGILIFSTPNPSSFQFRIFKKFWMHVDAPRHLSFIPPKLAEGYLRKYGMQKVYKTTKDPDGCMLSKLGWYHSVRHMFNSKHKSYFPLRIFSRALRMIGSPIESLLDQGAAYTIIFKKD